MSWRRGAGFALAAVVAPAAVYLADVAALGHRLPVGPDGPLYTWWTRYAGVAGLGAIPGRPGAVALTLGLGDLFGSDASSTVAAAGPVLSIAGGLAAAATVHLLLGSDLLRSGAAALFVSAWSAHLAASWIASLLLAVLFLAAVATLGEPRGSSRTVGLGAALLAAAGLTHRSMFVLIVVVVGAAAFLLLRGGSARAQAGRMLIGLGLGGGVAVGGHFLLRAAPAFGDTSQDAFLRRTGLRHILADRFRERLAGDARRAALPAAAAGALWRLGRAGWSRRGEVFAAVCLSWAGLTAAGMLALAFVPRAQGNRLVAFAFFVPLVAAPGFAWLWRRGRQVVAVAAAAVLVGGAFLGWLRQDVYVGAHELRLAAAAGEVVRELPPGTPIVFLVDHRDDAASFHVTRYWNVIRSAIPPERIADVVVSVGSPSDHRAGRPTLTGDEEHDELSRRFLRPPPEPPGVTIVLRPFNRPWYAEALRDGTEVSGGVIVLGGPRTDLGAVTAGPGEGGAPAWVSQAILIGGFLAGLALVGFGWTRWALRRRDRPAALWLAPSAGAAVVVLGAVGADAFAVGHLRRWAIVGIAIAGYLAAWFLPRHHELGEEGVGVAGQGTDPRSTAKVADDEDQEDERER